MVTFIVIMAPLYMIALAIYNWGISNMRDEMTRTMESQINFYMSNLETEIQRINTLLNSMLDDENLNNLAYYANQMDQYGRAKAINTLRQRLLVLQNSNLYIQSLTAYVPSAAIDVSSNDGMEAFDRDSYLFLNKAHAALGEGLIHNGDRLLLRAMMPINETYRISHSIPLISLTLSQQKIAQTLRQLGSGADSGAILFSSGAGIRISAAPNEPFDRLLEAQANTVAAGSGRGVSSLEYEGISYYFVCLTSPSLKMTMAKFIPMEEVTRAANEFRRLFWLFALISFLIIAIFSVSTFKFIQQPMLKLVRSLRQVEKGNLSIVIADRRKDEYGYLYHRFNEMVRNVNQLIEQVYKQQIRMQRAELKQLQSQINPHFLYNTYFVLYNMAMSEDHEHVKLFTRKLGSYFQYITRNASDDVPLELEAQNAKTYGDIQAIRFYNRISVDFGDVPDDCGRLEVPRLILQPLIENAFEHALEDRKGRGILRIRFRREADAVVIAVEDNGTGLDDAALDKLRRWFGSGDESGDESAETTAMVNIHRRVRLKFGPGSGLSVERSELGGLRVEVKLQRREG